MHLYRADRDSVVEAFKMWPESAPSFVELGSDYLAWTCREGRLFAAYSSAPDPRAGLMIYEVTDFNVGWVAGEMSGDALVQVELEGRLKRLLEEASNEQRQGSGDWQGSGSPHVPRVPRDG